MSAFPEGEKKMIATLAVNLLSEATSPAIIALVSEVGGKVVGHMALSPVTVESNEKWRGYILAPLAVKPQFQNRRIGSELVERGKKRLSENGVNVLFVYGDPEYYGKVGFQADTASRYIPPYELKYPFGWQAVELNEANSPEFKLNLSCVASLRNPELW